MNCFFFHLPRPIPFLTLVALFSILLHLACFPNSSVNCQVTNFVYTFLFIHMSFFILLLTFLVKAKDVEEVLNVEAEESDEGLPSESDFDDDSGSESCK